MTSLRSLKDLDAALVAAQAEPILIFKHSPTCGVSAQASEDIGELIDGAPLPVALYLVSVVAQREVSDAITKRLGVRHESPQILLVHRDEVLWHASHFRVSAAEIQKALQRHVSPAAR
jgi:bacillithiol system protein YtxJ